MSIERLRGEYVPEHEVFSCPDDPNTVIWRYIDFTKLVSMLQTRSLFFAAATRVSDPFEGSYSRFNVATRPEVYKDDIPPEQLANIAAFISHIRDWTFINCWTMSQSENAAFWGLYVPPQGGVAIRSTFDRLVRSFEGAADGDTRGVKFYIGPVNYVDYDTAWMPEGNTMWPFVHKRHSFEFEHELRAVCQELPTGEEGIDFAQPRSPGQHLAVDLDRLVERIHVSPTAPEWFADLVTDVCARYELSAPIEQSGLAGSPVY
jgi:hypothetical protein